MILALENSGGEGSVALVDKDTLIREIRFENPRGRGGALFQALEEIMQSRPTLARIVVGVGPGSYNGIRSAISAAWGISLSHGVPLVGLSSLLALSEGRFRAVGDARSGQFYFARVEGSNFLQEPILLHLPELLAVAGEEEGEIFAAGPLEEVPHARVKAPSAFLLGKLGAKIQPGTSVPEPIYLKPAHITVAGKSA